MIKSRNACSAVLALLGFGAPTISYADTEIMVCDSSDENAYERNSQNDTSAVPSAESDLTDQEQIPELNTCPVVPGHELFDSQRFLTTATKSVIG